MIPDLFRIQHMVDIASGDDRFGHPENRTAGFILGDCCAADFLDMSDAFDSIESDPR